MGLDEAKKALLADSLFGYRGDPDVSLSPSTKEPLIECTGTSYVSRTVLQFLDGRLYSIILFMNERALDHYSLYTQLSGRYGSPSELSPQRAVWDSGEVRLSLERPLTVRYVDSYALAKLRERSIVLESAKELDRADFISQF
jgi:hypothetical protein